MFDSARAWVKAVKDDDTAAMWELLSDDSQEFYERALRGQDGVRMEVKRLKAGLEGLTSEEEKQRIREDLKKYPDDPDNMTPKDLYAWLRRDVSDAEKDNTARLWAKDNIEDIRVTDDSAVLVLKNGTPLEYNWVREEGKWRFQLATETEQKLDFIRKVESRSQEN